MANFQSQLLLFSEGGKQVQISMKLSSGQDSGNSQEQTNPPNKMMDTVEKTLPKEKKDNFEIEVADEHGKAGQVEIDSPEEELQERMYIFIGWCATMCFY